MIQKSLFLSLILRLWNALCASRFGRFFGRFCRGVGKAWRDSAIVTWFCSPPYGDAVLTGKIHSSACKNYRKLHLDRTLDGSIFLHGFFFCALASALAPILPTMAVLALALVGCGTTLLSVLHRGGDGFSSPLRLPVAVFVAIYAVGTLHSKDLGGSLYIAVLTVAFLLFSFFLFRAVENRSQLDALLALLVTAGAAVSAYGILQYLFGWGYQSQAWVDDEMFDAIGFRVTATLQNPNMLGEYLVLALPLGGAKLLTAKGVWRKLWYLACCGAMAVCLILTFSRGAWLALLCAAAVLVALACPRLLALAPLALIALYFVMPQSILSRFTSIGNLGDSSTSYRVHIWQGSLRMLLDGNWLLGIGPGEEAFRAVYPIYAHSTVVAPHSHNLFMQIVCDAGIGALLAFLWTLVRYFRVLCGAMRRTADRAERLVQASFAAGTAGFLVQAMTDYSFYNYRVMFLFWTYLTVGLLCARRGQLAEGRLSL